MIGGALLIKSIGTHRDEILHRSGDHMNQNILTPAVLQYCPEVPLPRRPVFDSIQNTDIVPPGQLCNKLLHNCFFRPGLGQGTHVLEASGAEALDARKLILEIMGKPVDNPGTPTLGSLPGEDIPANRPIKEHQLAIDRERGTNLGGTDASFELLEELMVAGG
jgi:hypothetical protein